MLTSRFAYRFAFLSLLVALGLGGLVFFLHSFQMKRHAARQLALAEEAVAGQDDKEFLTALERHLGFDPHNKEVRTRYALALAERATDTRLRWRALQVLRQVIAEHAGSPEVRLRAIELALAVQEPDQATKYLEPLLRAEPERADLHVLAARCDLARDKPADAAASLRRALELAPARVETVELLVGVYRDRMRSPDKARTALDRFVAANRSLAPAYLARGKYALSEARLDDAAKDLEAAAKLAPGDIDVVQTQAEVETLRGDLGRAAGLWKRAIALAPERVAPYVGLAAVARERGETAVALDALRRAGELAPDRLDLMFSLGDLLVEAGKVAEGRVLQKALVEAAPGQADFLLGRVAQYEKRWLDAIHAYIASLKARDMTSELAGRAYFEMSRCYAELGGRAEEVQALEAAILLSPAAPPRLALARGLVQARRFEDALPWLRGLVALRSPPRAAWGLLARVLVERNRLLPPTSREWDEAERAIAEAATDRTQDVSVALIRADVEVLRDKPAGALAILESACQVHPDQPALYLALAEIASAQLDPARAAAALAGGDKAMKDRPDWLWFRIDRLSAPGEGADAELALLESRVEALPEDKRGPLARHLVEVHQRRGAHGDVKRLCFWLLCRQDNDTQVRLWLIESLLAQNDLAGAKRHLVELRKHEGEKGLGWRCASAELLLRQTGPDEKARLEEARGLIAFASAARPNWPHPIFLRAQLADKEGKTDAALADFRRVLDLGDYRPLALNRVLEILDGKQQWADALAVCEVALQKGALDRGMQKVAVDFALKANRKPRACDLAALLVSEGGRNYRDQIWLGNVLDAAARSLAALAAFERARDLAPDATEPYLALMAHHVRHRRRHQAAEVLEQMKTALDEPRAALAVARGHEILARADLAESAYREILKGRPNDPVVLGRLAALLVRHDKNRLAEPVLRLLLEPRVGLPDEAIPELRRRLALVLTAPEWKEDRADEALRLLDLNKPRGEDALDARTRALVLGRRGGAVETPASGMVLQEERRLAQLYDARGDSARARAIFAELIRKDPVNAGTIAALLESLHRDKRRAEGVEWLDRLGKLEPDSDRVKEFRRRWEKPAS